MSGNESSVDDGQTDATSTSESGQVAREQAGSLSELGKLMARVQQQQQDLASFTFGGLADTLPPLSSISVNGCGPIPLPLVDHEDAKRLAGVCERAPSPCAAFADASAGKPCQLDAGKVTVDNQAWRDGLAALGSQIADRFGFVDTPLTLHLDKFLFHEAGGPSGSLCRTKSRDGMFATLVVQLPSIHSGGQLAVYKGGDSMTHDFGAVAGTTASGCHFAVHHSDLEHEVLSVTQGYRLLLVYAVCWPADRARSTIPSTVDDDVVSQMAACLWHLSKQERHFYLFLDHEYPAELSTGQGNTVFKGVDHERLVSLRAANTLLSEDRRYAFFVAKARIDRRFVSHSYGDVSLSKTCAIAFADLQHLDGGTRIPGNCSPDKYFGDEDILNPDAETLKDPWERRPKAQDENGVHESELPERWTKNVLIAWPDRDWHRLTIACVGETNYFCNNILARHILPDASLRSFLELTKKFHAPTVRELKSKMRLENLCVIVVQTLVKRPFNQQLLDLLLDIYSMTDMLQSPFADRRAFLPLLMWEEARPTVRVRLFDMLSPDPLLILTAVVQCREDGAQDMAETLIKVLLRSEHGLGRGDHGFNCAKPFTILRYALSEPNAAVCGNVVQRLLNSPDARLSFEPGMDALLGIRSDSPDDYSEAKRDAIRPYVERSLAWLREERDETALPRPAEDYWRFDSADFYHDARVEAFLRGPERTITISGLDAAEARDLVANCEERMPVEAATNVEAWRRRGWRPFSFTTAATFEADDGRTSCVTLTKTDLYPQQRQLGRSWKVKRLDKQLAEWASLLVVSSRPRASAETVQIEAEAEPNRDGVHEKDVQQAQGASTLQPKPDEGSKPAAAPSSARSRRATSPHSQDGADEGQEHRSKRIKTDE
ncbi:uncharacterized protein PFL1_05996 [Pseudozyma flocculosa PF-1]|uniref:Fe2OG dioxygenase domain-containing protein n=2 Tax=Pseudozyma flocculosa TaxID=84751 RepID=A0A5C3F519_9BASI|nr:uncharacterized protein PFL1_05996 [Pseudozyma flocculosa PF-1]EPQ26348.1 hypothetical protein PFL1_05996 [Pseudozyma flocculosa PF-1]SPO39066.1 uncharacterized protein PSFLO_04545 [Pseudozyma flocculosa]